MDQESLHFWKTLDIGRLQLFHLKGNSGLVTDLYFVTKIVQTYCEKKKIVLVIKIFF